MRIRFLGVGGWISRWPLHYTSFLVKDGEDSLLVEAGEGVWFALRRCGEDLPKAVYVSHVHGDHMLGVPTLLLWARQMGRRITVVGSREVIDGVRQVLAAIGMQHLESNAEFLVAEPGSSIEAAGFRLSFAEAVHAVRTLSVRIERGGVCVAYSGDTAPSQAFIELARGCDVVIHEAAANSGDEEEAHAKGHSTVDEAVEAGEKAGARIVVPIHFFVYPPAIGRRGNATIVMPAECYELDPGELRAKAFY